MKVTAAILGLWLALGTGAAFASEDDALDAPSGAIVLSKTELWTAGGWTYAPVKTLAERMGWQLGYDAATGSVSLQNGLGDELDFGADEPEVTYNGKRYEIAGTARLRDGSVYFPLRLLAESMHASVLWQPEDKSAAIRQEATYAVQAGDSVWGISRAYGTTMEALRLRNGLTGDELAVGQALKVVVPEFLEADPAEAAAKKEAKPDIDPDELALLAKLVQAEAGDEPYEGKLAVASVVLNRVHNSRFPDTVKAVIYAPGQFSPARSGKLERMTPNEGSLKAAEEALSGKNNVPGALYFFNPALEPGKAKTARVVKKIGHHIFSK